MKIITVLLLIFAVFSQGVHSQKVDPFASSAVVATGKDDISPIPNSDPASGTTPNTEHHQEIKEAITNGRELEEVCKKFKNGIDVDDPLDTLQNWCSSHSCCPGDACIAWSPDATYEVCENTCNGANACIGVASSAKSGASIKFKPGSCNGFNSCIGIAASTTNLQTLVVGENSCTESSSCNGAAFTATSLKQLFIDDEQCKSSNDCSDCGASSTFDDTLKLTETCCAADSGYTDEACNYFDLTSNEPSLIPSTSSLPSDQPSSIPSLIPSDIPSDSPSDQPSTLPSLIPSDIPSDSPSDIPSDSPSDQPSSIPSLIPSDIPSNSPSDQPSSEPTWLDDEQCKKKDPDNDICMELDGRCKIDCEDDENYVCVPGLCSYDKKWDKPTKKPKLRELMNEKLEIVEIEVSAIGNTGRKLKTPKAPKATKAPKSSCACSVPKRNKCN